jgi:murein DD-endopeptidase MepM/ murein hydrolase activator NlpD
VTYKVYVRKDYKPVIRNVYEPLLFGNRNINWALVVMLCIIAGLILGMRSHELSAPIIKHINHSNPTYTFTPLTTNQNIHTIEPVMQSLEPADDEVYASPFPAEKSVQSQPGLSVQNMVATVIPDNWESLRIESGDNLSLIFNRLKISPAILHEIMSLGKKVDILKRLMPDHEMRFLIEDGELTAMQYDINLTDTLNISRQADAYTAEMVKTELETRINEGAGVITDSLFLTAQRAGLSDNLTMQLVELYGWDIDFALDIRKGDRFHVIFEEKYKDGKKVQEGPILVAEFINRDKPFRAVRYTHPDGYTGYYNEDGFSMRKAFLRTPVKFSRISSRFSLGRRHPILNKMRAHRGVDYAAPTGTPVKATGDGIISFTGTKGGYGRVIILRHGEKYSTLYGHLSKFARDISKGQRVRQGQIIGYVGMSGLATGPHLHYEFRIYDVHYNPLTVDLPKAIGIPGEIMADFKAKTLPLLAQLDSHIASKDNRSIVATLNKSDEVESSE